MAQVIGTLSQVLSGISYSRHDNDQVDFFHCATLEDHKKVNIVGSMKTVTPI
jgi:hypothetical protein